MLADNIGVSRSQRVPGIEILPLRESTIGSDIPEILNAVLRQLGFANGIDPGPWIRQHQGRRPTAIVHAASVVAVDGPSAMTLARDEVEMLLDLIALRRRAAPRLIAGVVGTRSGGQLTVVGSWSEGPGYTGELLGGFISGEDPYSLLDQWTGFAVEPRARLWLSLFADALADQRWDYRIFRLFNLLEGIAKEVVPPTSKVPDPAGGWRKQSNGKPYTAKEARGAVFLLLRDVAAKTNQAETNFTAGIGGAGGGALWDEVGLFVAVRNAVAHRGSWELPSGQQPDAQWVKRHNDLIARGHDGTPNAGADAVIRALRSGSESVLQLALRGGL
jgi:hypothetical protein